MRKDRIAEDEKEEQERAGLEKTRRERLVLEQRKRAFQKFSRLSQRQKSPKLIRYYIAGDNLRSLRNNRVAPTPQMEEARPSAPALAILRNQEQDARTSHLPVAKTDVVPEVPRKSSCDSAMEGIIEEGCVILTPYTCSGPEVQTSSTMEVAPAGLLPTLSENKQVLPINDDDGDVNMDIEPVDPPTMRHSSPKPQIQLPTPYPPMSPSPTGPVPPLRQVNRPTNTNMVLSGTPTPAPTPSPAPAPHPRILPVSVNKMFCGVPNLAPTPTPAPTPKPVLISQPMAPTPTPDQPPRNVFQPMNINTFPAGAATQPAASRLIAKPHSIVRRKDATGVQIPGLDHLNGGGQESPASAQGDRRPLLFEAGSGPRQVGLRQVQAQGESFNFGMETEQKSAGRPQSIPANQTPAPVPAPVGAFSVPSSAPAQTATVSAPTAGPTQPPASEPVHDSRFD